MGKFICVFNKKDREAIERAGFTPVNSDRNQICFLFVYDPKIEFDWSNIEYTLTDVLCF